MKKNVSFWVRVENFERIIDLVLFLLGFEGWVLFCLAIRRWRTEDYPRLFGLDAEFTLNLCFGNSLGSSWNLGTSKEFEIAGLKNLERFHVGRKKEVFSEFLGLKSLVLEGFLFFFELINLLLLFGPIATKFFTLCLWICLIAGNTLNLYIHNLSN